ncbi:GNAT family N-acetyltransferase [Bacillus pinisoli]|uniref:GNAT family N-acetyltransferase n=1 Tax=Bacillus pinisoli TaxID=2901866 RepID=UPI001FF2C149|nr:GNAT family protein [Bacillus pinisoli]
MNIQDVTLKGERVSLSPLREKDLDKVYKAVDSTDIWRLLPNKLESIEDVTLQITQAIKAKEQGLQLPFVVFDHESEQIVGMTRLLNISTENKQAEIGATWYSKKVWRTRVNTECKYLLLRHCFEELKLIRVQFKVDTRNERSNNAVLRIGAKKEGTLRKEKILYDGYVRDTNVYSILEEEWPEVKGRLELLLINGDKQ